VLTTNLACIIAAMSAAGNWYFDLL